MSDRTFSESAIEQPGLCWFELMWYDILHGPVASPGELTAERNGYSEVILERRLRQKLSDLNPGLPPDALEDAYRKLTSVQAASLIERNRAVHDMLANGVTVAYRRDDGTIGGAQVRVIDYDDPDANDWLVINQFIVTEGQHSRRPDMVVFLSPWPILISSSAVCSASGASSTSSATSSCSRKPAKAGSSRRSPATTSSTPSTSPWRKPSARRCRLRTRCVALARSPPAATSRGRLMAARRATAGSAWCGTPRGRARA